MTKRDFMLASIAGWIVVHIGLVLLGAMLGGTASLHFWC